jgi:predicted membrane-bound spermidine synthase
VSELGAEPRVGPSWPWAALFAATGALALGVQIYLLRELLVALQGDEAAVGLGLGAWLAGIALGAVPGRLLGRVAPRGGAAAAVALLAVAGWGGMLLGRVGRSALGVPVGELATLGPSLWLALAVFALPGVLVGAAFVALAAAAGTAMGGRAAIGRLYVLEALGSLGGGLLASFVLVPHLPPLRGLGLLIGAALGLATPAAWLGLIRGRWLIPALAAAALAVALGPLAGRAEAATERLRFASLVQGLPLLDWDDTPYQHVTLGGGDVRSLFASGQYVSSFPDPTEDEGRAHRLMLLAERSTRVLALGGLETGTLRFCLQHPVAQLDLVALDRRAFELVARHLEPVDRVALDAPSVRVVFDDPRAFLARGADPYDLILSLQPDPATLLLARDTTVEFDRLVARRLGPQGVYVTRFSAGPNAQAGQTGLMGATLYRSLREVFAVVRATPGPDALFVAGQSPELVTLDPKVLGARWRARGIESEVFVPELLPLGWPRERVATLGRELEQAAARVEPTHDDRPVSFLYALTVRQRIARSAWAPALDWAASHRAWVVAAALGPSLLALALLLLVQARRRLGIAALHATAVTGACGMAWSLLLFFSFQTRVGALYSQLGALSAVFMLGLAAGGWWIGRQGDGPAALRRAQLVTLGGALLLALALPALGWWTASRIVLAAVHALLLGVAGVATGVVLPSAAGALLDAGAPTSGAASWVELADHAGAAVAALLAAVVVVPLLGLGRGAALLVALQVLAFAGSALAARSVSAAR